MKEFTWSNKLGHRGRRAWLFLVGPGDQLHEFTGKDIPGIVVVKGTDYFKNGKWSHFVYRLMLAEGVRPIAGRQGWETSTLEEGLRDATKFPKPIDRWSDMANAFGVSVPVLREFLLNTGRERVVERLDAIDKKLEELDEVTYYINEVSLSFGGPTNREISEGFWEWPVVVTLNGNKIGVVSPKHNSWTNPDVEGDVRVISAVHSSGYHGGYVSLRLAVPEGAVVKHTQEVRGGHAETGREKEDRWLTE